MLRSGAEKRDAMFASGGAIPPASCARSTSRAGREARRVTASVSSFDRPTTAPRTGTCRNGRSASRGALARRVSRESGLVGTANGDGRGTAQQVRELVATGLLRRDLAEPVLHHAIRDSL